MTDKALRTISVFVVSSVSANESRRAANSLLTSMLSLTFAIALSRWVAMSPRLAHPQRETGKSVARKVHSFLGTFNIDLWLGNVVYPALKMRRNCGEDVDGCPRGGIHHVQFATQKQNSSPKGGIPFTTRTCNIRYAPYGRFFSARLLSFHCRHRHSHQNGSSL